MYDIVVMIQLLENQRDMHLLNMKMNEIFAPRTMYVSFAYAISNSC